MPLGGRIRALASKKSKGSVPGELGVVVGGRQETGMLQV